MYAEILAVGPVVIKTLNVLLVLALFSTTFVLWKKTRDEHYDETIVFDGFLLSIIFGLIMGRMVFVIERLNYFGSNILTMLDIFAHPGVNFFAAVLFASLYMFRFARRKKWDEFEVMDFWVTALSLGLSITWLGFFFEGINIGVSTNLPWGIMFEGVLEKHHPTGLYFFIFYLLLFVYLSWVEFKYRTFNWYRNGKNTAQSGFLTAVFLMSAGLFSFLMSFILLPGLTIYSIKLDMVISLICLALGVVLMLVRSGRIMRPKKHTPLKMVEEIISQ